MADPTDIEFRLKTTGDTAGAEKVEKSIFKATDAAEEANRAADVAAVQGKRAAEVQEEQAAALNEVAEAAHRIVAAQLAQAIGQIGDEFKGLGPEIELVINASRNFLNVLATTGDPIKATLAVAATAIGAVVTAYRDAAEVTGKIAKDEEKHLKKIAELRQAFAAQLRAENLTAFFQRETDALDEQEATLRRIAQIQQSERDLEAARRATGSAAAVAGGASPEGQAAVDLETGLNARVQEIQDKLTNAAAALNLAQTNASNLALQADALQQNSDAQKEALTQAQAAAADAARLAGDFDALQQVAANEIARLGEEAKRAGIQIADAGLEALTDAATAQRDALKAEVDRLGANASSGAREALAILEKILEDLVVKPDELARLAEAQARVRTSQEALNGEVKKGFDDTARGFDAVVNLIQPALARIADSAARIERMEGLFITGPRR